MSRLAAIEFNYTHQDINLEDLGANSSDSLNNKTPASFLAKYIEVETNKTKETLNIIKVINFTEKDLSLFGANNHEILNQNQDSFESLENQIETESELKQRLLDIDSLYVSLCSGDTIYSIMQLPFNDPKKAHDVVKAEIPEIVPIDSELFIVDSKVIGQNSLGTNDVITSVASKQHIENCINICKFLGKEPKVISSRASDLSGLKPFIFTDSEEEIDAFAIVEIAKEAAFLSIYSKQSLVHSREIKRLSSNSNDNKNLIKDIKASFLKSELKTNVKIERIYFVGKKSMEEEMSKIFQLPCFALESNSYISNIENEKQNNGKLAWILGLLSPEVIKTKDKQRYQINNFRRDEFSYKPGFGRIVEALSEEKIFFIAAPLAALIFFISSYFILDKNLADLEVEITKAATVSSEKPPFRQEKEYLIGKVNEIEEKLTLMGSLSSLAPIDTIKELSTAISSEIDLDISNLRISASRVSFRGSVPNPSTLERLSRALEIKKDKFCNVEVLSVGRQNKDKIGYTAEIEICE